MDKYEANMKKYKADMDAYNAAQSGEASGGERLSSGETPAAEKVSLGRKESGIPDEAKEILQKDIDEKRAEIDELKELNRRLRLAMEELQATGSWQGEKYDIRINDQGKLPPATATREEIEAQAVKNGITLEEEVAKYVKEAEAAGYKRKYEIDQLQKKLDAAQENFDTITKERSDNTFHMEELLAIPEIKEEILRRREEVLGLSYSDRDKRWSDPNDPDAYYVIHWGASQFVGGELDPARSRGVDGPLQAENTRSINMYTAKPYVEETARLRDTQETAKKVLADFAAEKDMNVGPPGRITSRERKILEDYNLGSAINDDGTIKWDEIRESLGDGYQEWLKKQVARIQEDLDKQEPRIARRERISEQLVADGYQYSSAYNARALTQGFAGYGGRYADEGAEIGAGASSGERAAKSPVTGIHVFRVTPETATSLGGGEDHLIGKHTPIATLVAKNDGMTDTNPAVNAWEGWVDMAIQADIAKRSKSTEASSGGERLSSGATGSSGLASVSSRPISSDELLSNPKTAEEIRKRNAEVEALDVQERYKRYRDPSDPDAFYVLHWGASELVDGELNPARSRGTDTGSTIGNTRAINVNTSKIFIGETSQMRKEQEEKKKLLAEISFGSDINVGPKGRNENWNSTARNILESYGFNGFISDDGKIRWDRMKEVLGENAEERYNANIARIQKNIDDKEKRILRDEKISEQLIKDDYQYSSSLYAAQMKPGWGYLGRYQDEGADTGAGASWGNNAAGASIGGIHVFRVTPETSTSMGSDEVHLVGKHKPVATLTVPTSNAQDDNGIRRTWKGWVDMVIEADIAKRSKSTEASSGGERLSSGGKAPRSSKEILDEAAGLGIEWQGKSIGTSEEDIGRKVGSSIKTLRKSKELGLTDVPELSDDIKKIVSDYAAGNISLKGMRQAILYTNPRDEQVARWARGNEQLPIGWRVAVSREIALEQNDAELVKKIDDFIAFMGDIDNVSDEKLEELIKKASDDFGKNMGSPIIQTPDVKRIIRGAGGVTVHDSDERKLDNLSGTTGMGESLTISARRRAETMYGLPFTGENTPEDRAITAMRPISGHSLPKDAHVAREKKMKKIYGEDFTTMYDFPIGADVADLSQTEKYGRSHIILSDAVNERTKVVNGDAVSRFGSDGAAVTDLESVGEAGIAYADPIGMLYSSMTGDSGGSIAGPLDPSFQYSGKYNETATLGTFDPGEVKAIYVADIGQLRRGVGDTPSGINPDYYGNLSLIFDFAITRDEILDSRGTEIVAQIGEPRGTNGQMGVLEYLHPENVELFNSSMTSAWLDRYENIFGEIPREILIPEDEPETTPYEAYLRAKINERSKNGVGKLKETAATFGETRDGKEFDVDVIQEELDRAINARKNRASGGERLSSGSAKRSPGLKANRDRSVSEYGMDWKPEYSDKEWVGSAKTWDGWSDIPTTEVDLSSEIRPTESHLKGSSIDKVVSGEEAFREGYYPNVVIDTDGKMYVSDGHNRVAMNRALGNEKMTARVVDLREQDAPWGNKTPDTAETRLSSGEGPRSKKPTRVKKYKGYDLKEPDNPGPKDGEYPDDVIEAAQAQRDKVAKVEAEITKLLIDLAEKNNANMEGLDYRMKALKSLVRKIAAEKDEEHGGDAKKAAEAMSDIARYTMSYEPEDYIEGVKDVVEQMQKLGYELNVKNYWKGGDPYQGINVAVVHPDGTRFELQFHTPQSVADKEKIHAIYEDYRTETDPRKRFIMYNRMVRMAEKIGVPYPPEALLEIGNVREQPFTPR
jgi:hypothetical protein